MSRHFAITIAYDGTEYGGWQIQPNSVTIQQLLIDALRQATGERAHVQGSGRTDAGVHAVGQIGAFALEHWRAPAQRLVPAINRHLPASIVVRDCRDVVLGFDPIRDAVGKRYRYTIRNARVGDCMQRRFHWWLPRKLAVEPMQSAAKYLIGTHDFKSFESIGSVRKTSVRTVRELTVRSAPAIDGVDIVIEIEADGFLYNMVRNITGALVDVGSERFAPRRMQLVLDARVRDTTSQTAPARGLCLDSVQYPPHMFLSDRGSVSSPKS